MTAGSTSQQALSARTPRLLAFAALVAYGALAVPASASAFNPQPDPPGHSVAPERISATHVDPSDPSIGDVEDKFLGGPDTKRVGDAEDKFLGGPDTKLIGDAEN
jgi:hypothetical protein